MAIFFENAKKAAKVIFFFNILFFLSYSTHKKGQNLEGVEI